MLPMTDDYLAKVSGLTTEKALAIAAYGESVAAYRYRTLIETESSQAHREVFREMADEEQGHHDRLQEFLDQYFTGSDFVLKPEEKGLVIVGPRLLAATSHTSFDQAIKMICESERLTGRFYAALLLVVEIDQLKPFLKEMADECFQHADKLERITRTN
jgi:rubrerythrin